MKPLDRSNAQLRRKATAMQSETLQQRLENEQQRMRTRELRASHEALRTRMGLGQNRPNGAPRTLPRWT
jgi:hypothetical protein